MDDNNNENTQEPGESRDTGAAGDDGKTGKKDSGKSVKIPPEAEKELKELLGGENGDGEDRETGDAGEERFEASRDRTFDDTGPSADPEIPGDMQTNDEKFEEDYPITESDKEAFLESVLHDRPFVLDIPVLSGVNVRVRSRSVYEQNLCYECASELAGNRSGIKDVLLALQKMSVSLGIVSVNGEPFSGLELSQNGDGKSRDEHKKMLTDFAENHLSDISYPRWQFLVNAFYAFTFKEKKLLQNVANRDFWNPAD